MEFRKYSLNPSRDLSPWHARFQSKELLFIFYRHLTDQ